MVEVGGRPILWHIMRIYSAAGFRRFVLPLGYKGSMIRDYFLNYRAKSSDITVRLGEQSEVEFHNSGTVEDWSVTLVDTGEKAMTGARLARVAEHLDVPHFLLTYGDGVADIDIGRVYDFHRSHGKIGTVLGVHSPSRFGKLSLDDSTNAVTNFTEKPLESGSSDFINGGFFVFDREFLNLVSESEDCILERTPLETLSSKQELMIFRHEGYWQCMDTYRDWMVLDNLWKTGEAPWKRYCAL